MISLTGMVQGGMMPATKPPLGGALRVRVTDGLILNAGAWRLAADRHQTPTAIIEPPSVPMFQQVVEYLEAKPIPTGGNMRRADEARAAAAVCLRWGSYFALLADPSRPDAPHLDDELVSQIDDGEMARLNVEISAAIAWWFSLCGSNGERYWDLVHRALVYLPVGPKTVRPAPYGDRLLACAMPKMAAQVRRAWPADRLDQDLALAQDHGVRVFANTITLHAWRNGPIEDLHAGRSPKASRASAKTGRTTGSGDGFGRLPATSWPTTPGGRPPSHLLPAARRPIDDSKRSRELTHRRKTAANWTPLGHCGCGPWS